MGYTHYWETTKTSGDEQKYQQALTDMVKVINTKSDILANGNGEEGTQPKIDDGISFNGIEGDSHETFVLPNTFSQLGGFAFCKTARKPYDIVVTACLTILKNAMGNAINVSSDGDKNDWNDGVELANSIIGGNLTNPIEEKNEDVF